MKISHDQKMYGGGGDGKDITRFGYIGFTLQAILHALTSHYVRWATALRCSFAVNGEQCDEQDN